MATRYLPIMPDEKFGHLVTLAEQRPGRAGVPAMVLCRCTCGKERDFVVKSLRRGAFQSCGCQRGNLVRLAKTKHGHTSLSSPHSQTYNSWAGMVGRCTNPKNRKWANYGGRGIKICERWRGPDGFANFLADMGERPPGTSIDRIDNNGNYTHLNCRWATPIEQANNRRPRIRGYKRRAKRAA